MSGGVRFATPPATPLSLISLRIAASSSGRPGVAVPPFAPSVASCGATLLCEYEAADCSEPLIPRRDFVLNRRVPFRACSQTKFAISLRAPISKSGTFRACSQTKFAISLRAPISKSGTFRACSQTKCVFPLRIHPLQENFSRLIFNINLYIKVFLYKIFELNNLIIYNYLK
jgi:hypothetical protein